MMVLFVHEIVLALLALACAYWVLRFWQVWPQRLELQWLQKDCMTSQRMLDLQKQLFAHRVSRWQCLAHGVLLFIFYNFAYFSFGAVTLNAGIVIAAISLLWVIAFVDWHNRIIADWPLFALALLGAFAAQWPLWPFTTPSLSLWGLLVVAFCLFLSWLARWLWQVMRHFSLRFGALKFGDGDVLLLFAISFLVGVDVLYVLFIAALLCLPLSVFLHILRQKDSESKLPSKDRSRAFSLPFAPPLLVGLLAYWFAPVPLYFSFNQSALFWLSFW